MRTTSEPATKKMRWRQAYHMYVVILTSVAIIIVVLLLFGGLISAIIDSHKPADNLWTTINDVRYQTVTIDGKQYLIFIRGDNGVCALPVEQPTTEPLSAEKAP